MSDLILLLLGFLVVWYLLGKNNLNATNLPAPKPKSLPIWDPIHIDRRDWQTIREEIERFVAKTGLAQEIAIESAPNEIVISLSNTVSFDSGNAHLREQAMPVLQKIVAVVLNRDALSLEVRGHTDNAFISNTKFHSNWELSTTRASRVARYLIDNGFDSSRISVRGYANQRPRAANPTVDNGGADSRRVEIRVYRSVDQNPVR